MPEFKGTNYDEVIISKTEDSIDANLIIAIADNFRDDGACVQNAYRTAKLTGAICVEGFVICKEPPTELTVIRHCWNKIKVEHFDVTKDYIWEKRGRETIFHYFPIAEFEYSLYNPQNKKSFEIGFLSDAVEIAAGVKQEIFEELKRNQKL